MMMGSGSPAGLPYIVRYCHAKTLYVDGEVDNAQSEMAQLGSEMQELLCTAPEDGGVLADWHSKVLTCQGKWAITDLLGDGLDDCNVSDVQAALGHFGCAIEASPTNYKSWYSLASLHYTLASNKGSGCPSCCLVADSPSDSASNEDWAKWYSEIESDQWVQHHISHLNEEDESRTPRMNAAEGAEDDDAQDTKRVSDRARRLKKSIQSHIAHVVLAIRGFFKSIQLRQSRGTTDLILRLLTLWFRHGSSSRVTHALAEGFNLVPVDTWLSVMPQIIARAHTRSEKVRDQISDLLSRIGAQHPQAVVWPLSVASETQTGRVMDAVMGSMRQHSGQLVEQAEMVAHELVRVAILWEEQWTARIHEAHAHYLKGDEQGMMMPLITMHRVMRESCLTAPLPPAESSDEEWKEWMRAAEGCNASTGNSIVFGR